MKNTMAKKTKKETVQALLRGDIRRGFAPSVTGETMPAIEAMRIEADERNCGDALYITHTNEEKGAIVGSELRTPEEKAVLLKKIYGARVRLWSEETISQAYAYLISREYVLWIIERDYLKLPSFVIDDEDDITGRYIGMTPEEIAYDRYKRGIYTYTEYLCVCSCEDAKPLPRIKHKFCPHCGRKLTPSHTSGYAYECKNCDEDFYEFEAQERK